MAINLTIRIRKNSVSVPLCILDFTDAPSQKRPL